MIQTVLAAIFIAFFIVFTVRTIEVLVIASSKAASKSTEGYIYFISEWGFIVPVLKIGRTNNVKRRLNSFKTGTPFGIITYLIIHTKDDVKLESHLHNRYAYCRIRGSGEWFWITPAMILDMIFIRIYQMIWRRF